MSNDLLEAIVPDTLEVDIETWRLTAPFRITGHTFQELDVIVVTIRKDGLSGRGEAVGMFYRKDTARSLRNEIERHRAALESGLSHEGLCQLLPTGGARNALDCALWDLEAKLRGSPVWRLVKLGTPQPILTTFGCGADSPERMAYAARAHAQARAIKLKLTGDAIDADRVRAVREARPDVWLAIDANQGFSLSFLQKIMPVLVDARVSLIEQPLRVGEESSLDGFDSPIPIAADESAESLVDLSRAQGRFDMVNIKLDKCGGLTEALAIAKRAKEMGMETMVGNMIGTSLAMAPAWLVGQLCKVVDLDGPLFLRDDRDSRVSYEDGYISVPEAVWGGG